MTTRHLISNATHPPLLLGEGLGVRSMAGQFLKAAAVSTEKAVEMMKLTKRQIEVTMFAAGVSRLESLKIGRLVTDYRSEQGMSTHNK
jgi:isopentenyl diphosphate isomerase/L-lactate dehydrogenase-like FMN-dependent dehydrogenase